MGGVGLGLGALYVAFGALLITQTGFALGLIITLGMAWGQWFFSDTLALKSMGAKVVAPEQASELHAMIDRLCSLADMPKVAISVTDMPNAFAAGRTPKHSAVCVTTGIMQRLDADELEGVLAHELAHIANRDVSVMTVASSLGLLAGFITRWGMYFGGGRGRNNNGGGIPFLAVLAVSLVVYFVSFLLTRALSRYRELSADRSGAYLTGRPSTLSSALVKISGEMARIPNKDLLEGSAISASFSAPAINRESVGALMSTHPPLQQRLDNLAKIGAELSEKG